MAQYQVAELFESINGEGMHAGELAVFVRFRGCNLCCSYCDTRWACVEDAPCTVMQGREICSRILQSGIQNVTLTGGEPLLQEHIEELLLQLAQETALRVEIETNGSVSAAPYRITKRSPVFTFDYKLPGSGMEDRMCLDNFAQIQAEDTVKFVASDPKDLERAGEIIREYDLAKRCHVILSPVYGRISPEIMVEYMRKERWNRVRLQLQMHKIIWDPAKRGV